MLFRIKLVLIGVLIILLLGFAILRGSVLRQVSYTGVSTEAIGENQSIRYLTKLKWNCCGVRTIPTRLLAFNHVSFGAMIATLIILESISGLILTIILVILLFKASLKK